MKKKNTQLQTSLDFNAKEKKPRTEAQQFAAMRNFAKFRIESATGQLTRINSKYITGFEKVLIDAAIISLCKLKKHWKTEEIFLENKSL